MKALKYNLEQNAIKALQAGCNLVLHCNGNMKEMNKLAKVIPKIDKFTQNFHRLSLSLLCLTVPVTSLFLVSEYLGYKKFVIETGEDFSREVEEIVDKLKSQSPELNEWLP